MSGKLDTRSVDCSPCSSVCCSAWLSVCNKSRTAEIKFVMKFDIEEFYIYLSAYSRFG
jgi:hypothetical protein